MLLKKKSRSIDARKSDTHHHHHGQSIDLKPRKFQRTLSKKSVDLTMEAMEQNVKGLEPIAEELRGKKWR
jgi:hypothetical protein